MVQIQKCGVGAQKKKKEKRERSAAGTTDSYSSLTRGAYGATEHLLSVRWGVAWLLDFSPFFTNFLFLTSLCI